MADVKRVSGKMQLDTEGGGVVRATYEMAVETNKPFGSFTGQIDVTKAEKEATGRFTAEIGVAKAELGNKGAAGVSTREIGVAKAKLWNKEAAGSSTRQICFTKPDLEDKESAGSSTRPIGVTQAVLNKDVGASSIGVTKVVLGNKEQKAVLGNKEEVTWAPAAGVGIKMPATVTWAAGFRPPSWTQKSREERKAEHVGPLVTKETVPDHQIERMKKRPMRRMSPLSRDRYNFYSAHPTRLAIELATIAYINHLVDVEEDCLRQHEQKGYAEIGVDYTSGSRVVFILPS